LLPLKNTKCLMTVMTGAPVANTWLLLLPRLALTESSHYSLFVWSALQEWRNTMDNMEMICLDCLYWHEHGSLDGLSTQRYWEVASYASGAFVIDVPTDDSDGFVAFSREPCDACETHLAGQRFPATKTQARLNRIAWRDNA